MRSSSPWYVGALILTASAAVAPDAGAQPTPPHDQARKGTRVRVIDEAGRPLPRARVVLIEGGDLRPLLSVLADPEYPGRYRLDENGEADEFASDRDRRVVAVLAGHGCSTWAPLPNEGGVVELRVVRGNTIGGQLKDSATGKPLANVRLTLQLGHAGRVPWVGRVYRSTDSEGRYRFAGIPAGLTVYPQVQDSVRVVGDAWGRAAADTPTPEAEVKRGGAIRLAGVGENHELDLTVATRGGHWAQVQLKFPDGAELPSALNVRHESLRFAPGAGPASGGTRASGSIYSRPVGGGTLTTRTWTYSVPLIAGEPVVRLFVLHGRNRLRLGGGARGSGPHGDIAVWDVSAEAAPQSRSVEIRERPLSVQLVTGGSASRPVRRAGWRVAVWVVERRRDTGAALLGSGVGEFTTDADGRFELTGRLPLLSPDGEGPERGIVRTLEFRRPATAGSSASEVLFRTPINTLLRQLRETAGARAVIRVPVIE